jgi:DUF4097 and DUF4098 domain-containing protein YvlB
MARYEREVELAAPLEAGGFFSAETGDGSIRIEGTQTSECKATAKIVAHARTEEEAQELAEQIEVTLEPVREGLKVVTQGPPRIRNAWYSVSIAAQVPVRTRLALDTSDGSIQVANITGDVDAKTSDGSIKVEAVNGNVTLRTSDGGVTCTRLEAETLEVRTNDGEVHITDTTAQSCWAHTADGSIAIEGVRADSITARTNDGAIRCRHVAADRTDCHTSDGSIYIEYTAEAPKAPDITARTSDGGITLVTPPGLSATVEASTDDGSIDTSLPITVQGKIGKSLNGAIGAGEGRVYLRTHDGSITIR